LLQQGHGERTARRPVGIEVSNDDDTCMKLDRVSEHFSRCLSAFECRGWRKLTQWKGNVIQPINSAIGVNLLECRR
jgi:hypothetical protein